MSTTRITLAGTGFCLAAIFMAQIAVEWMRIPARPHLPIMVVSAVAVGYTVSRRNAGWGGAVCGAVAGTALVLVVGFLIAAAYVLTGAAAAERVGPVLLMAIARGVLVWALGGILVGVIAGQFLARPPARARPAPAGSDR